LLLIAKLGEKDDVEAMYACLDSGSTVLQSRALQSIVALQAKATAASTKP
jgi:hypothetical protein